MSRPPSWPFLPMDFVRERELLKGAQQPGDSIPPSDTLRIPANARIVKGVGPDGAIILVVEVLLGTDLND